MVSRAWRSLAMYVVARAFFRLREKVREARMRACHQKARAMDLK